MKEEVLRRVKYKKLFLRTIQKKFEEIRFFSKNSLDELSKKKKVLRNYKDKSF